MGRTDRNDPEPHEPAPPGDVGSDNPHGMGVSSEHDAGEVQEVDSREQE